MLDEISMVSNIRLAQIHLRLNEIFNQNTNNNTTFGCKNIILFGDLLQVRVILTSSIV